MNAPRSTSEDDLDATSSGELVEAELLPPEPEADEPSGRSLWRRLEDAFGPIAAGVVIDALDIATFGRFGLVAGMIIGGSAAFWMSSIYKLPLWQRFLWALAAGIYCTVPRTEFIPLATLMGACARYVHGAAGAGR